MIYLFSILTRSDRYSPVLLMPVAYTIVRSVAHI